MAKRKTKPKATTDGRKRYPPAHYRNSKLTPEILDAVVSIVRKGNFRTHAFARVGISESSWCQWIRKGRREIAEIASGERDASHLTLCAHLVSQLEAAEAEVACTINRDVLTAVDQHGQRDWKALAWFAERRFSKLYSRNLNAVVEGEESDPEQSARGREVLFARILRALGRELIE